MIGTIIVGILAGWLAGKLMHGVGYGLIGDLILGLVGGVIGGWIFARLNEEGRTVVLITHEPDVARQSKRVIRLSDGEIVADERTLGVDDAPPVLGGQKSAHSEIDTDLVERQP